MDKKENLDPDEMTAIRNDIESLKAKMSLLMWLSVASVIINLIIKLWAALPHNPPAVPSTTIEGGNVTVGSSEKPESRKVYLTTAEVAEAERISDRQVVQLISTGRIHPPPERSGRAWRIAADYRILPQTAAVSGTTESQ